MDLKRMLDLAGVPLQEGKDWMSDRISDKDRFKATKEVAKELDPIGLKVHSDGSWELIVRGVGPDQLRAAVKRNRNK